MGSISGIAECKELKALILHTKGQDDSALDLINEAICFCECSGSQILESALYISRANIYATIGDRTKRDSDFKKSLEICEKTGEMLKRMTTEKFIQQIKLHELDRHGITRLKHSELWISSKSKDRSESKSMFENKYKLTPNIVGRSAYNKGLEPIRMVYDPENMSTKNIAVLIDILSDTLGVDLDIVRINPLPPSHLK